MITNPTDFFSKGCGRCARFSTPDCSVQLWREGLASLHKIALEAGLSETAKWGHPCYMHAGRNIAIIGAFRGEFRLTFFNASLMKDPAQLLQHQGPNTRHPDALRFTSSAQIAPLTSTILAYLTEAMGYAEAGLKSPKHSPEIDLPEELPEELAEALDADPTLARAFAALTPGRKKSHVIALSSAKTSATRHARIARQSAKILAGKGATER